MTVATGMDLLVLGAFAIATASLARSIHTMSVASQALVAAATTLAATAQALADNLPNEDSAQTTSDVNATAALISQAQAILGPLAPTPA